MDLGALTCAFLVIIHIGFVEPNCGSWPSSSGQTCTAGGEYILLGSGMSSSDTQKCANLCKKELNDGCCALSQEAQDDYGRDFNGCYWKGGQKSVALASANYKTITCNNDGVSGIPKPSGGGALSSSGSDFANGQLNRHNQYRQKHGANNLWLDNTLTSGAQDWANHLAAKGQWLTLEDHADLDGIGENIAFECGIPTAPSGDRATDSWYNEVKDYRYSNPGFGYNTGHFTQVVWKNTARLGIAKAKGKAFKDGRNWDCTWIVGRYEPPGNYAGQYENNVGRAQY